MNLHKKVHHCQLAPKKIPKSNIFEKIQLKHLPKLLNRINWKLTGLIEKHCMSNWLIFTKKFITDNSKLTNEFFPWKWITNDFIIAQYNYTKVSYINLNSIVYKPHFCWRNAFHVKREKMSLKKELFLTIMTS